MARQRPTRAPHVEIDRIVIREVQYQLEVNRCRNEEIIVKCNFGWAGRPRINRIVIREVQNEEIIVKGNFEWARPMWAGAPVLVMEPCIAEIDRIVIRQVQDQFEVNRFRNEEIIIKGNFGWAWPMWAGRPRIDRIVIREVQYQFEDNRCRNEEIIFQGYSANSDGRTDRRTAEITTISPRFSKSITLGYGVGLGEMRVVNGENIPYRKIADYSCGKESGQKDNGLQ
ncbi:hypothetical protein DPMN_006521 [Dreissena polymorpha]|uniref:Uncharacterized protein n=1 Tax=Dreissena polymorpha TaxID=45954 RepID=A0A9D4MVL4_DREPO|nr:hypothetical protein DPMN_006521 [Dreissena polymorpha]